MHSKIKGVDIHKQADHCSEKCRQCPVRDSVLFADLRAEDLALLSIPINDVALQAGETLFNETELSNHVYTIRSGMVKLVRFLPNGSYRIVRLLSFGDLAGIEALNGGRHYLHHAIALQDTVACKIPIEDIESINRQSTYLYQQLTARWQKVQSDADVWLTDLSMGSSKSRVANLLIYLDDHSSTDYFFLPSREDIGALLAVSTETASRVIAAFKRAGFLHIQQNIASIDRSKAPDYLAE